MNGILLAGGIGGAVALVQFFVILHYRTLYQEVRVRTDLLAQTLKQREGEVISIVAERMRKEAKYDRTLVEANSQIAALQALVDKCADPAVVRARLSDLGNRLSVFGEKSKLPDDVRAAAGPLLEDAPTDPDHVPNLRPK